MNAAACNSSLKILLEYQFFSEMLKQGTRKHERLQRYACLNTDHFFFQWGRTEGYYYGTRIGMNIIIFFTPAPPNMDTLRRACPTYTGYAG